MTDVYTMDVSIDRHGNNTLFPRVDLWCVRPRGLVPEFKLVGYSLIDVLLHVFFNSALHHSAHFSGRY